MGFSRQEYWSGLTLPSPQQELDTADYKFPKKQLGQTSYLGHVLLGGHACLP